jgi:hypothetical protein
MWYIGSERVFFASHHRSPCSGDSQSLWRAINNVPVQFKFIVPSAVAGSLLASGAAIAKNVESATSVLIKFSKPGCASFNPHDRLMILGGESPAKCKAALAMIFDALEADGTAHCFACNPKHLGAFFLKQIMPAAAAGKVLGPGGEQLAAICAETGASVIVEAKLANAAFVPFRCIAYAAPTMSSLLAAIERAMDLMVLEQKYVEGIKEISSVAVKIIEVAERSVGALLGPRGAHIKALQEMLRVKIGLQEAGKAGTRHVTLWGHPLNVKVAVDAVLVACGELMEVRRRQEALEERRWQGDDGGSEASFMAPPSMFFAYM